MGTKLKISHVLAIIALSFLLARPSFSSAMGAAIPLGIPAPNDSDWKKYFPEAKLNNPAILSAISHLTKAQDMNSPQVWDIAKFGGEAIPYILRLSGERNYHLVLIASDRSPIDILPINRYQAQASWAISAIQDKGASENLKKIMTSPHLGIYARQALARIDAVLTKDEAETLVDAESKSYLIGYRLHDEIEPLLKHLKPDDAATVFSNLLKPGMIYPFMDIENASNLRHLRPDQIELWRYIVKDLGATKSPIAFEKLNNQFSCLMSHPGGPTDTLQPAMIEEYKKALAGMQLPIVIVPATGCRIDIADNILAGSNKQAAPYEATSTTWKFSFSVLGDTDLIKVTVKQDGVPITDRDGIRWSDRKVQLEPGGSLTFQERFNLVWIHSPPLGHYPTFDVQAQDLRGNSGHLVVRGYWGN